jgi:hypothetical protein
MALVMAGMHASMVGEWTIGNDFHSSTLSLEVTAGPVFSFTGTNTGTTYLTYFGSPATLTGTIAPKTRRLTGLVPAEYVEELAETEFKTKAGVHLELSDTTVAGKEVVGLYHMKLSYKDGAESSMAWTKNSNMQTMMLPRVCLEHTDGTVSGLAALHNNSVIVRFEGRSCGEAFKEEQATVHCRPGFTSCPESYEGVQDWLQSVDTRRLQTASSATRGAISATLVFMLVTLMVGVI